ncbi:MAG: 6-bladed beta-propeller [Odoribacter sp.]|nr:6-bladed beta-propeller [Odoribacter sp.]
MPRQQRAATIPPNGRHIVWDEQNLKKPWHLSELFDSVRVIPLETNEESLIGEITRLQYVKDHFYILDRKTKALLVFDHQGKFLWKIQSVGRGPQEYTRLIDLDIDPEKETINLYVGYPQKLMQYDLNGKFINEYNIGINANSIALQSDRLILNAANQANLIEGEMADPQLLIKHLKTDSLYTYLPATLKDNRHTCLIFNYGEGIFRYGKELLLFLPLDNNIYAVHGKTPEIKYRFDFGNYNLPAHLTLEDIRKSNYVHGLNSFWENERFCYFQATLNQYLFDFLYHKEKDILYHGYLADDIGYYMPHIVSADNKYMLCYANINELMSNAQYLEEKKGEHHHPVSKLIRQIKEADNPVLLLYRFKQ